MAGPTEILQLRTRQETEFHESINRRTDDILWNVRYLERNIVDKTKGLFAPGVEADVLEQDTTEVAEADVHNLGPIVYQALDKRTGQYVSLSRGTVDNAVTGVTSLDMDDPVNHFDFFRRVEDVTDEEMILEPEVNESMRAGRKKVSIFPAPTEYEASPDVAKDFGYDGRTMFRVQSLSKDGLNKKMQSFSVFEIPASAWAAFLTDRYRESVEPTALAVIQFCNRLILETGSTEDILMDFIGGVMNYLPEKDKEKVGQQLDAFLHEQDELKKHAEYYGREKLELEKDLALCWNGPASPAVRIMIDNVYSHLNQSEQQKVLERIHDGELFVDEYIAGLAIRIKTVTTDNRAGLAVLNEKTIERVALSVGLEAALQMAMREHYIQQAAEGNIDNEFMVRRAEQQIAEAGVGCGGGCSVDVVDLFSEAAVKAREAGLKGTLYQSKELDNNSKCHCASKGKKAKVISDGKNVVCTNCGDFQVKGQRGNLKKKAA
ncbi:hypothetical protein A3D14_00690 [Candidatus Saccharibacteria bacterium RIFCSPHIGHO2_02_FULL_47_12]|nr:MAG: hypothetical protein A3D14_00690 [Candidatus Saccharibacteria bacterium RIFCSPHIGHO2_02_FULL_47_12]